MTAAYFSTSLLGKAMVRTIVCAAFCVLTTQAFAACVKPEIPVCAKVSGPFKTQAEFTVCRAKMETYRSYAETYGLCRQTELLDTLEAVTTRAQQDLDEVANNFSWAVDRFNRRSGNDGLPASSRHAALREGRGLVGGKSTQYRPITFPIGRTGTAELAIPCHVLDPAEGELRRGRIRTCLRWCYFVIALFEERSWRRTARWPPI